MVGNRSQQGATYAQIASSICPPPNSDTSASSQKPLYDDIRESNVILFGLPEEKSIVETKATNSNDHVTQGASATSVTVAPANAPSSLQSSHVHFSSPSHLISLTDSCSSSSTLSSATVVQDASDPV